MSFRTVPGLNAAGKIDQHFLPRITAENIEGIENYRGNRNYVQAVEPLSPSKGDTWYNPGNKMTQVWNGSYWEQIAGATSGGNSGGTTLTGSQVAPGLWELNISDNDTSVSESVVEPGLISLIVN